MDPGHHSNLDQFSIAIFTATVRSPTSRHFLSGRGTLANTRDQLNRHIGGSEAVAGWQQRLSFGAKPIPTEHLPLGPTEPSQLVEIENSFATVAESKVTALSVLSFAVLASFAILPLLFPTLTVPKFTSYES
jgi:hypothetical protein